MGQRYKVEVSLFGGLEIRVDGQVVSGPLVRAKKLRMVAEYLYINRGRAVPYDELAAALWPEDDSANPRGALKTALHRLRRALVQGGAPEGLEFFAGGQGECRWNPLLRSESDADQFAVACRQSEDARLLRSEQLDWLRRAVGLYTGRVCADAPDAAWLSPLQAQVHAAFVSVLERLCALLGEDGARAEAVEVCRRALEADAEDIALNRCYLLALSAAGQEDAARAHYEKLTDRYYSKLGVQPPDELLVLYRELGGQSAQQVSDVRSVCEKLAEPQPPEGAFVCEYEVFKDLYRREARNLARYGGQVSLALITLTDQHQGIPERALIGRTMEQVLAVIRRTVRRGDVVARYGPTQFVLLLPTVDQDTGEQVLGRIRDNFRRAHPHGGMQLVYQLHAVQPAVGEPAKP